MFSVVIPTYNRSETLRTTLAALEAQQLPASEVIVVDDGSTDGTADLVSSVDWLKLVRTNRVGVSSARNAGLALASAEFVVFLDDDDKPHPGWLEALSHLVEADVGIVSCAASLHRANGDRSIRRPNKGHAGRSALFLAGTFASRRSLLLDVGGYLDGLTYAENTEIGMRLTQRCTDLGLAMRSTEEPLIDLARARVRRAKTDRYHALLRVIDAHSQTFESDPERLARWLSIAAVDAWRDGDRAVSRKLVWRCARLRPLSSRAWARAVAASIPPLGDRVWGSAS